MLTKTPLDDPYGRAPDSNNVAIPLSSSTGDFLPPYKAKIVPEWRMRPDWFVAGAFWRAFQPHDRDLAMDQSASFRVRSAQIRDQGF
jgi:hypothetical protein